MPRLLRASANRSNLSISCASRLDCSCGESELHQALGTDRMGGEHYINATVQGAFAVEQITSGDQDTSRLVDFRKLPRGPVARPASPHP